MWIEHQDVFYNLDKFNQIQRGEDDEILLANISHNGDWDEDEERSLCILNYTDKAERELAWDGFRTLIELLK